MLANSSGFQLEPLQVSWKEFHLLFLLHTFLKCNRSVKLFISLHSCWHSFSITSIMLHIISKSYLLCFLAGRRKGTFRGKNFLHFYSCVFVWCYLEVYCVSDTAKILRYWWKDIPCSSCTRCFLSVVLKDTFWLRFWKGEKNQWGLGCWVEEVVICPISDLNQLCTGSKGLSSSR